MIFSFCSMRVRLVFTTKLSRGDLLQEEFLSVAGHLPGIGQLFHGLKELPGEKDDGTLFPPNSFAR